MLHHRQKLHMGISHILYVLRQLFGDLPVIVELAAHDLLAVLVHGKGLANPGAQMHLIDGHGLLFIICLVPLLHPHIICPLIAVNIPDNGRVVGAQLPIAAIWIRFEHGVSVLGLYLILIDTACIQAGDKQLKHPVVPKPSHLVAAAVPHIKVAHNAHPHGAGSPHRKVHALYALDLHDMGTHLLVHIIADARVKFFQSGLVKLGLIGIGIPHLLGSPVVIGH
jgi:hypothetical protein